MPACGLGDTVCTHSTHGTAACVHAPTPTHLDYAQLVNVLQLVQARDLLATLQDIQQTGRLFGWPSAMPPSQGAQSEAAVPAAIAALDPPQTRPVPGCGWWLTDARNTSLMPVILSLLLTCWMNSAQVYPSGTGTATFLHGRSSSTDTGPTEVKPGTTSQCPLPDPAAPDWVAPLWLDVLHKHKHQPRGLLHSVASRGGNHGGGYIDG